LNTHLKTATLGLALALSGCATIISGSRQDVHINSYPKEARVAINEIDMGPTPLQQKLKRNQEYTLLLELEGYEPYITTLKKKFNAWYLGNVLIGGLIGLVVDPITGAMYQLKPEEIDGQSKEGTSYTMDNGTLYLTISMEVDPNWEQVGQLQRKP